MLFALMVGSVVAFATAPVPAYGQWVAFDKPETLYAAVQQPSPATPSPEQLQTYAAFRTWISKQPADVQQAADDVVSGAMRRSCEARDSRKRKSSRPSNP